MTAVINDIVVVGGGLAAGMAVETLRNEGFDGRLTLLTEEAVRPYERPPLSKDVLMGKASPDTVFVHPEGFYSEHGIEILAGDPVVAIHRSAGTVVTRAGAALPFDRLLLVTGAAPRAPRLTDRPLEGIRTLRTLDDSLRLREDILAAGHVTIVGAGWIGCEVASAARSLGAAVTVVEPLPTPLHRVLGAQVGAVFADLHRDHGVDLRTGRSVTSVAGGRHVEEVTLDDGATIQTGLVVLGVGVIPRTELAGSAGLAVDDGVVVDETLCTGDARIFAAGDVASALHPAYGRHVRVEHWANARNQGPVAAGNMLGAGMVYDRLPYFFSDQYDLGMEYVGHATTWDAVVVRGSLAAREFVAFWLSGGRVAAAMNVNVWDVVEDLKAIVGAAGPVDAGRLADPDVPLAALANR